MSLRFKSKELLFIAILLLFVVIPLQLAAQTTTLPKFGHVVIVVEENTNYSSVVGSSIMPYLNSLINQYGLATNYDATTHPSIGNYFSLTTGQILDNNDNDTPSSFTISGDNIVRELNAAGVSWKDYAESIPSVGYLGGSSGSYYVRHNPIPYFSDVNCGTSACIVQADKIVPFTQFANDLSSGNLPQFSFVVPNGCDDAHDCSLSTADSWLQSNISPLISNASFQKDGLLIIVFDENSSTGTSCSTSGTTTSNCGGQVADVIVSPLIKSAGLKVSTFYNHFSTLRTILQGLGVTTFPGVSSSATAMADFFGTASTPNTPVASFSPNPLPSFGSVNVGSTSAAQTVTLTNTGNATLTISSIAANGDFFATNNCGSSLAAGAHCSISVTFSPITTGSLSGQVLVSDNAGTGSQTVGLTGTGGSSTSNTPGASLSPASLSFGSVTVGSTSSAQAVTLTNTGSATLNISGIVASANFADTSTCGTTLAAAAHCTISVTFKPTTSGTLSGQILVSDNAGSGSQAVTLSGTGGSSTSGGGAGITMTPTSLSFGTVQQNTSSAAQSVILHNGTSSTATLSPVWVGWSYTQTNNCGSSLAAGASCTINVTFTPLGTGTINENLVITAAGKSITTPLTGVGTTGSTTSGPVASLSPSSLTFASRPVGSTSPAQMVTLKNTGTANLNIAGIAVTGAFADPNNCPASLAPGASCSISVTFTPQSAGSFTGQLMVSDNAPASPQSASLTGTGGSSTSGGGGITLTPTSFNFGSVKQGSSSSAAPFVLHNGTSSPAAMYSVWVGWSYTQTNNCGSSLAAGASCAINVTFTPLGTGTINENLAVDAGGVNINVPMTGTGF